MRGGTRSRTDAIGVVLPVHNEELQIGDAMRAVRTALLHPDVVSHDCRLAIVLDSCDDGTAKIVDSWRDRRFLKRLSVIECGSGSVGKARQIGCKALLNEWGDLDPTRIWIATTDADSEVPPDWLAVQSIRHDAGYDFWAGRVAVRDWSTRGDKTASEWSLRYSGEVAPVHGASLGFNAAAYLEAGGFEPLMTGEDRALHSMFAARGRAICHDHLAPVMTSARRNGRAPKGFAHRLNLIEAASSVGDLLTAANG